MLNAKDSNSKHPGNPRQNEKTKTMNNSTREEREETQGGGEARAKGPEQALTVEGPTRDDAFQ